MIETTTLTITLKQRGNKIVTYGLPLRKNFFIKSNKRKSNPQPKNQRKLNKEGNHSQRQRIL